MDQNLNQQPQAPVQPTQPLMQTEQVSTPTVSSTPPVPPAKAQNYSVSQSEHQHGGKAFLKVLLVLIIIIGATVGVVYAGYVFLGSPKSSSTETKNANVFVEPTLAVTPTPAGYQSNLSDTTDGALDSDTQVSTKDMDNLDTELTNVDQGLSDQQTNLQ